MSAASDNLRDCQRQLDMDGCEVGVSRQAVEEVLAEREALAKVVEMIAKAELYDPATGIIDADVLEIVQDEARKALAHD